MHATQRPILALLILLLLEAALVISWSAGFVGTRFAVSHAPIFLVLFWRNLTSGLILLPFAFFIGPRLELKEIAAQMLFGALGMGAYLASFALALDQGVPTGLVALIADMLPLAVAVLSWPMLGHVLTPRQWLGSALGVAGVVIASAASLSLAAVPLWAYGLPVAGTLCFALATLMHKRSTAARASVVQSLAIQCLSAAAIFSVFAAHEGSLAPIMDASFIGGILWLVFVATYASWSLYLVALRKSSPARVTAVLYLSPPVTMIWAWIMFAEPLSWAMAAGLGVSLLGIMIMTRDGKTVSD